MYLGIGLHSMSLQDSIDLFLGNYTVDRYEGTSVPSPLQVDQPWRFKVVRMYELWYAIALSVCSI